MSKPDLYVDCRGKLCPIPVLEVRQAIDEIDEGTVVVVVDRLAAKENITWAMLEAGHEVLVEEEEGGWVMTITKTADEPLPSPDELAAGPSGGPTVVLLADRGLGRTDPALGAILMKSFLSTVSSLPVPPAAILLIQGAVELACGGSDCVELLQVLSEAGVAVLACGTCLDYLGLMDRLQAGRVTNMAEIVERLMSAGKVISL